MTNKPQAIEYTTPHKTVVLSNIKQLVVKQGFKCIDGGYVKVSGKFVPLMVRYDNKPELTALVEAWQAEWNAYNTWLDQQVEIAKSSMVFGPDRDNAENADFLWSCWDGTSGKTLREKSTGREIYQMRYTDGSGDVEGDDKTKVMAFWRALEELKNAPAAPMYTPEEMARIEKMEQEQEAVNDHLGWCNICHSYCYGDCTS